MKHNILKTLLFGTILILNINEIFAQTPDTVYCFTQTDKKFLSYYVAANQFDSASVIYRIGEMTIRDSSTIKRVYPTATSDYYYKIEADGGTSHQVRLDSMMRWENVQIPSNGQLHFFRHVGVAPWEPVNGNETSTFFVRDITTFKLEARHPTTGAVLWVADSVRLDSGRTMSNVTPRGTNPTSTYHVVSIPSGLWGQSVKFVVRPERVAGPDSPYGMSATRVYNGYNLSFHYLGGGNGMIKPADLDSIRARWFRHWYNWAAATFQAYCVLPSYSGFPFRAADILKLRTDFYQFDTVVSGYGTIRRLKACTGDSCGTFTKMAALPNGGKGSSFEEGMRIERVWREGQEVLIEISRSKLTSKVMMTAYLPNGSEIGWADYRTFSPGRVVMGVTLTNDYPGPVLIVLRDENSRGLANVVAPPK